MSDYLKKAQEEWQASLAEGKTITVPEGYVELRRAVKAILDHLQQPDTGDHRPCQACRRWMDQQERGHEEIVRGLEQALAEARKDAKAWKTQAEYLTGRFR